MAVYYLIIIPDFSRVNINILKKYKDIERGSLIISALAY